ncbi:TadA family conjugal transfer-associated ATPase [Zafaria sp. J156]|uniref:TadA family conjugal transfer-associated ATPase n=1 Tax=Zafaria sp. J156 TaxID=3116490 RepID=UPI002E79E229|nr:TadA family conjugal transfer-associated ATPase [Zafaria sp. J156]MEE1621351.1 TadA family conjugal transfer-associated ATPase [Zafaria sp. J156]
MSPERLRGRHCWDESGTGTEGTEPDLAARAAPVDERVVEHVRERALATGTSLSGADLAGAVRASGLVVGSGSAARVVRMLQEDLQGLGPLQEFAEQPGTTDVLVDGAGRVWTDSADGLAETGFVFASPEDVRRLAVRLVASGGRRLDDAQPFADVVAGRYRIHAVLPPVATEGPLLSVRVKRAAAARLVDILPGGAGDPWLAPLRAVVTARLNFLISGGTGTGKTTLLAAMLAEAGPDERLLIVEDSRELSPDHPHVVGLQCRSGNIEGSGGVGLPELVRQALRMRPDRLIVGECRGAEVGDFLAAMNTGHDGAGGTLHASAAAAVPARLAAMGALAGLSPAAVAVQAGSAIDLVVHMERSGGRRRPVGIGLLEPAGDGLAIESAWQEGPGGVAGPGPAAGRLGDLLARRGVPWTG